MSSKLDRVTTWPDLARSAHNCVKELAELSGSSVRHLRRHFRKAKATTPQEYLQRLRHAAGQKELEAGGSVAKASQAAAYARPSDYARAFKRLNGYSPHALSSDNYAI